MSVNNAMYEERAHTWWQSGSPLSMLRMLNPGRIAYLLPVLERTGRDLTGLRVLDVGCGGGFLTETLAKLGCDVTGVDPSAGTVAAARAHADEMGLAIRYEVGSGEGLPFEDGAFDLVTCCDVLEHVEDLDAVLAESRRVLDRHGLYFYDTINRTPLSWLLLIKLAQDWPLTRAVPPETHAYEKFIKPTELIASMQRSGLESRDLTGLAPSLDPRRLAALVAGYVRGDVDPVLLGEKAGFGPSRLTLAVYMGWAEPAK